MASQLDIDDVCAGNPLAQEKSGSASQEIDSFGVGMECLMAAENRGRKPEKREHPIKADTMRLLALCCHGEPCECGSKHIFDHSEFGLPLGFDRRCERCGRMWSAIGEA